LGMVINVGSSSKVSGFREGAEYSEGSGTSNSSCINFPEDHSGGFKKTERGVYGE
jgi:hypothetical protein